MDEHLFNSLPDARNLLLACCNDFNNDQPHASLAGMWAANYAYWSKHDQNLNKANLD